MRTIPSIHYIKQNIFLYFTSLQSFTSLNDEHLPKLQPCLAAVYWHYTFFIPIIIIILGISVNACMFPSYLGSDGLSAAQTTIADAEQVSKIYLNLM